MHEVGERGIIRKVNNPVKKIRVKVRSETNGYVKG